MIVRKLVTVLGYRIAGANLLKYKHQLGQLTRGLKAAAGMAVLAGATLAAVGGVKLLSYMTKINVEFEKLMAMLTQVEGGAAKAAKQFKILERFAVDTPFELQGITKAYITLKTAGLDASYGTLTAYGDIAAQWGRTIQDVSYSVVRAVQGDFRRLRAFSIMAKKKGDKIELGFKGGPTQTVRNNVVEIQAALRKIAKENFAGAMALQMNTIEGKASNVVDALNEWMRAAGTSGYNQSLKDGLDYAKKVILQLMPLAKMLGIYLSLAMDYVLNMFKGADKKTLPSLFTMLFIAGDLLVQAFEPFWDAWKVFTKFWKKNDMTAGVLTLLKLFRKGFNLIDKGGALKTTMSELKRLLEAFSGVKGEFAAKGTVVLIVALLDLTIVVLNYFLVALRVSMPWLLFLYDLVLAFAIGLTLVVDAIVRFSTTVIQLTTGLFIYLDILWDLFVGTMTGDLKKIKAALIDAFSVLKEFTPLFDALGLYTAKTYGIGGDSKGAKSGNKYASGYAGIAEAFRGRAMMGMGATPNILLGMGGLALQAYRGSVGSDDRRKDKPALNVGKVTVNIQGDTGMGEADIQSAVKKGVQGGILKALGNDVERYLTGSII